MSKQKLHVLTDKILHDKCTGFGVDFECSDLNTIIVEWLEGVRLKLEQSAYSNFANYQAEQCINEILHLPPPEEDLEESLAEELKKASPWIAIPRGERTTDGDDVFPNYRGVAITALTFLKEKGWGPKE